LKTVCKGSTISAENRPDTDLFIFDDVAKRHFLTEQIVASIIFGRNKLLLPSFLDGTNVLSQFLKYFFAMDTRKQMTTSKSFLRANK
jgi:hypothetical protein